MKKRLGIALVAIVVSCLLIAGCSSTEEQVINSPYTVSHELEKDHLSEKLVVSVEGPADDLLLILTRGEEEYEQEEFLSREQMAASSVSKATFFISKPGKYQLTIRKSDPSKTRGELLYKGPLVVEPGKIEIQKVVPSDWPFSDAKAVIHCEGFPVTIDHLMVYTDKGEEEFNVPVKMGPGETKKVLVSYDGRRGRDIRIYAYNSDDEVIATFEGKVT